MRSHRLALLVLAVLPLVPAGAVPDPPDAPANVQETRAEAPTLLRGTLEAGGLERSYALYVPDRLAAEPALVLVLHGSGGDADRIRGFTDRRFERLADRHGARDPDRDGDPATAIERRTWAAATGPEVSLITMVGAGHTIPRRPPGGTPFPPFVGPASAELDAVEEAWAFFERHRAGARASRADS